MGEGAARVPGGEGHQGFEEAGVGLVLRVFALAEAGHQLEGAAARPPSPRSPPATRVAVLHHLVVEVLHFERLGERGVGLVPLAELQEGDRKVDDRDGEQVASARSAGVGGGGTGGLDRSPQVAGPGEDVGQVELRSGQVAVVPGPLGQAGGLSKVRRPRPCGWRKRRRGPW